ncbi:bifunctional diguanylate cyclase/phosphodiesterase [Aliamphritea hakodatensis]|uniref:bifunctional diguanylate cyclase/phosphodiesterase n=1 Tax=Aliamphritea hakodatensis TaxID=2895352 RepID=UPI0022FD7A9E|nr:EAL domain-containing protein [Aliamphritea hakodatensis]
MSIVNQLMAAVLAVLLGLVSGSVYLMSDSSKAMLLNQLESHGQDTATHLGLYLAPYMLQEDEATIETTVNAIFDSGYYQQIKVVNNQGQELFSKSTPPQISEQVPQWFVDIVKIDPPEMTREVTSSWNKAGSIFVQSRAGYAYEQLWRGTKQTFLWFVVLSLLSIVFIHFLLRYILNPLKGVEDQAVALSERRYVEQENIPKSRELRRVVIAMNMMIQRVKAMFDAQAKQIEEIRRTAYQDDLTGLANYRSTQSQLVERLDYRKDFGNGTMIYLHIADLQGLNQKLGVEKSNNFIKATAGQMEKIAACCEQSVIGRLTGSDFVLLADLTNPDHLQRELNTLISSLHDYYRQLHHDSRDAQAPVYIGTTPFREDCNASQLIANARIASEQAVTDNNHVHSIQAQEQEQQQQNSWHQHVSDKVSRGDIFLQSQPVYAVGNTEKHLQQELFARILNQENEPCMAGEFISVIKQLDLMSELDKTVINKAIERLQKGDQNTFCINLSNDSLREDGFYNWFANAVRNLNAPQQLQIEINESSVLNNMEQVVRFRQQLKDSRIGFGVDNFGVHPAGFAYLYSLHPDYIKIDGSLIREIDNNAEDRFFVRSLSTVAHSLEIQAYAEHVERNEQLNVLAELEINGSQGWVHGRPVVLD